MGINMDINKNNIELTLRNNITVPKIALGTWMIPDGKVAKDTVIAACNCGYRAIDTASAYDNEKGVGEGIRNSNLRREELFVTTKLANKDHGYDNALRAFDISLEKLDISYIDQYLIHWPCPAFSKYVETYGALIRLYEEKVLKSIGVCNFNINHLEHLKKEYDFLPLVNQIEMHPMLIQPELLDYCKENNIQVEAYSPLMHGGEILKNDLILSLSKKYEKTPSQIILAYLLTYDVRILAKSTHLKRLKENIDIFDIELEKEDLHNIRLLNKRKRTCANPDTMNYVQ